MDSVDRRTVLAALSSAPLVASCGRVEPAPQRLSRTAPAIARFNASGPVVQHIEALGSLWKTRDPFLFCAHHNDAYPTANAAMGPLP